MSNLTGQFRRCACLTSQASSGGMHVQPHRPVQEVCMSNLTGQFRRYACPTSQASSEGVHVQACRQFPRAIGGRQSQLHNDQDTFHCSGGHAQTRAGKSCPHVQFCGYPCPAPGWGAGGAGVLRGGNGLTAARGHFNFIAQGDFFRRKRGLSHV
jgi:hypothetical protein